MEDVELLRNIATIAAPITKAVVDSWIVPKAKSLGEKWKRKNDVEDHYFQNKFRAYLTERYKSYSILNILAFRNQQRLLKDIYLPLTITMDSSVRQPIKHTVNDFDDGFISTYQRLLIVDTAGMGKSTISKKLFLSAVENNSGIPVFIELRRLTKSRTILDEIYRELQLINGEVDTRFVSDLISRGDFIFFFDGYDEISSDDKTSVTEDIQRFVNNSTNSIFILTSRPDDSLSSFGNFQSFSIDPLKENQVYELLNKYDENGDLSKSLIMKLKDSYFENLKEFLTNPLLVSLLFTAYEYKHMIPLKKHIFYRQVYDALFEAHDLSKGDYYQRDKFSKLGIDDFHTILRYISFLCMKKDKIEFTKDEILHIIKEAKSECEVIEFEKSKFLKDIITTVPLFIKEGLYYKWAHKSLYEYFVAQFIYQDTAENRPVLLENLAKSKYINILDIYLNIDYKTFKSVIVTNSVKDFINYCESRFIDSKIDKRLIFRRNEITYTKDLVLIQFDQTHGKDCTLDSFTSQSFEIMYDSGLKNRKTGIESFLDTYGIHMSQEISDNISKINYTVVLTKMIVQKAFASFVISAAYSKGEDFVKKTSWNSKLEFTNFCVEKRTILHITEDLNSSVNQPDNFEFVNEVISVFHSEHEIFDFMKCKEFLRNQEEKGIKGARDSFLEFD